MKVQAIFSNLKMLDQLHNLNYYFFNSGLYLFQGIVLLNPCFIYSENVILSFINKVATGT